MLNTWKGRQTSLTPPLYETLPRLIASGGDRTTETLSASLMPPTLPLESTTAARSVGRVAYQNSLARSYIMPSASTRSAGLSYLISKTCVLITDFRAFHKHASEPQVVPKSFTSSGSSSFSSTRGRYIVLPVR